MGSQQKEGQLKDFSEINMKWNTTNKPIRNVNQNKIVNLNFTFSTYIIWETMVRTTYCNIKNLRRSSELNLHNLPPIR